MSGQDKINAFFRHYVDKSYKNPRDMIRLSRANSWQHNMRVCQVCCWLLKEGIPFWTEVRFKCGWKPDIVCPTHIKQVIEVFGTETRESFNKQKLPVIPGELASEIIFVDAKAKWSEELIL